MERTAHISDCGTYRWSLRRVWDPALPCLGFIMLNPSTADGETDDATIRRCIGQAQRRGYGAIAVVNLFAYRATDPAEMKRAADPVGMFGDNAIIAYAEECETMIAGWGVHGTHAGRDEKVKALFANIGKPLYALRLTKDGHPGHPLYIPYDLDLVELVPARLSSQESTDG